jgi:uncharacterized membrane protein YhiD involved in acid resistance
MGIEDFLGDLGTDIVNYQQFLINGLATALLTYGLTVFYKRFGRSISNRSQFANNFMFLSLTTMLIIFIVKSSIALSLGLVGALSIVRFRAAIKEPEELVYLFFAIGIGLGMGANQPTVTILAYLLIMSLLVLQALVHRRHRITQPENMFVNISTRELKAEVINTELSKHFKWVELKRMDYLNQRLDLSYLVETNAVEDIIRAKDSLLSMSPELNFSFVESKNISV